MKTRTIILIIIGAIIISYPIANNIYSKYMEQKLMQEWEERMRNQNANDIADESTIESFLYLDEAFSQLSDEENEESTQETPEESFVTLGILKIDKIKVTIPVIEGSTPSVLRVGAGKLDGTTDIGKIGNTAISAHRSHNYGRQFNRLNEVDEGDTFNITTQQAVYHYEVFNIQVVEPDDVSLLKKSKTESIVTLITCHPLYTASHRLIVQGRLYQEDILSED